MTFVLGMTVLGAIAIVMSLHTIVGRFHDEGNDQSAQTRVVMNLSANEMLQYSAFGIGWNCFALGSITRIPSATLSMTRSGTTAESRRGLLKGSSRKPLLASLGGNGVSRVSDQLAVYRCDILVVPKGDVLLAWHGVRRIPGRAVCGADFDLRS